jgi:hypothetical protein
MRTAELSGGGYVGAGIGVETRTDFAHFLSAVLADFRATGASEWENGTLDRFLDAFAAFAGARVIGVPEQHQDHASWKLFARSCKPQPDTK